jgi:cytochrome P450
VIFMFGLLVSGSGRGGLAPAGTAPHACPGGPLVRLQAIAALRAAQAHDLLGRFAEQRLGRVPIVDETRFKRAR